MTRVLRPGGHFLYADFRGFLEFDDWDAALAALPMRMLSERVIDEEVLRGLDKNSPRYRELVVHQAQAEAKRLKLEQLKAAALHEIERLRARGLDDDVLTEWADRPPPEFWDEKGRVREENFERQKCPVCKFDGWLEYSTYRGPIEYDYGDDDRDGAPVMWIDIEHVPREFYCPVCSLRLGDDLLSLEGMGETRYDTVEPTPDEVWAAEEAAVERYLDNERRMK